jgi:NAD(P)H dehydrogenase (quinone)
VADAFEAAIAERGHVAERADLVAEGFDPVLWPEDEPDWSDPAKCYSAAVLAEMARIERNEATVMIFPVWWWSMPAVLKGWIDRVWNHGWAYGGRDYPHARVWTPGLAGGDADVYARRGYDAAMRTQIEVGILRYCGVAEPRHELLYGALDGPGATGEIVAAAARLGREF